MRQADTRTDREKDGEVFLEDCLNKGKPFLLRVVTLLTLPLKIKSVYLNLD